MINKLSVLCVSAFLASSVQAGVIIQCHNTPGDVAAEFVIDDSAAGYRITTKNAAPMPAEVQYMTSTRQTGIHQASLFLFTHTEREYHKFFLYYPSVHEKIKDVDGHDSGRKYEVDTLFNNFTFVPANPAAIHSVPNEGSVTEYKVTGYNLASVRFWDGNHGHEFHGCSIVNPAPVQKSNNN